MKKYAFYANGKFISEAMLFDDEEAKDRSLELAFVLSMAGQSPKIVIKEVKDGKETII